LLAASIRGFGIGISPLLICEIVPTWQLDFWCIQLPENPQNFVVSVSETDVNPIAIWYMSFVNLWKIRVSMSLTKQLQTWGPCKLIALNQACNAPNSSHVSWNSSYGNERRCGHKCICSLFVLGSFAWPIFKQTCHSIKSLCNSFVTLGIVCVLLVHGDLSVLLLTSFLLLTCMYRLQTQSKMLCTGLLLSLELNNVQVVANCLCALQEIYLAEASRSDGSLKDRDSLYTTSVIYLLINRWCNLWPILPNSKMFIYTSYSLR
jgi:hypothetical protein